jgi:hypothetical protein
VPHHDIRHASLERIDVEITTQVQAARHVVDSAPRLDLVEEPQALLGERQR